MAYRLPAHLRRNRYGTLYFRLSIPADLQADFHQNELYRSLGTASVREATLIAHHLYVTISRIFVELQQMDAEDRKKAADAALKALKTSPGLRDRMRVERLQRALREQEAELDRREWEIVGIEERHSIEVKALNGAIGRLASGSTTTVPPSRPLTDAIAAYIEEKTTRARWTNKTLEKRQHWFRLFQQFMGERLGHEPRLKEIDRAACVSFLSLLQKLPPNMTKNHAGRPLDEVAALGLPPMAAASINGILGFLSGFFDWCKENPAFKIDHNPAYKLSIDESGTKQLRAFRDEELVALLSSPAFRSKTFLHPYHYWIIPMALHTGARLGELCQLGLSDIIEVNGVPCIDINDEEEKALKNRNAKRLVPIHSCLIEMGLLRYVAALRQRGETRLFPEINLSISASHDASNWFNDKRRYSDSCGVTDPETNFHSFRRTFITRTIKKDGGGSAHPHDVAPIVGHEHGLITMDVYFDDKDDAAERRETVEKFRLPPAALSIIPPIEDVSFGTRPPRQRRAARS
ncbi:site-specific integrase [Ralstonia soli]|uniref:Site-specific integrase n=1 Tax=Ralstonia soli TaxID=2953896 RepID=A0ABT1AJN1_9RALS|nr:site-specific integrase [Ralstonia soli]MCO5398327.1 site-specific integrase [Ralstonia soli]